MRRLKYLIAFFLPLFPAAVVFSQGSQGEVLSPQRFEHYISAFNEQDEELYTQYFPNRDAWEFLKGNIPFFECPDKELEKTYYFFCDLVISGLIAEKASAFLWMERMCIRRLELKKYAYRY